MCKQGMQPHEGGGGGGRNVGGFGGGVSSDNLLPSASSAPDLYAHPCTDITSYGNQRASRGCNRVGMGFGMGLGGGVGVLVINCEKSI